MEPWREAWISACLVGNAETSKWLRENSLQGSADDIKWLWPKDKSSFFGFLESPVTHITDGAAQRFGARFLPWDEGMQGCRASARSVICCALSGLIYLCPMFLGDILYI